MSRKGEDTLLRETLAAIGRTGEVISFIRDSQLGADRIVPYVLGSAKEVELTSLAQSPSGNFMKDCKAF